MRGGIIAEEDVNNLVAYLKTLKEESPRRAVAWRLTSWQRDLVQRAGAPVP